MPKIFINYRTDDGDQLAAALDEALRHRFGDTEVFRDGRSIKPGSPFPQDLLQAVRRARVLLVVIGPRWSTAPELHRAGDWVRKEIAEAHECAIPVVPVRTSPSVPQLHKDELPTDLAWLAERQSLPYAPYTSTTDLARIGDELAELVPGLQDSTHSESPSAPGETQSSATGGNQGTVIQGRSQEFSGDIAGTMFKGNSGQFHTGKGDQHVHHNSPQFMGNGGIFVEGTNNGGAHQAFGDSRRERRTEDDER